MQSRMLVGVMVSCAVLCPFTFAGQTIPDAVAAEFAKRVDGYMAVRKSVSGSLSAGRSRETPKAVLERRAQLRNLVRTARKDAKPGEIFFPELVAVLAKVFQSDTFAISGRDASAIARESDRPPPQESVPRINEEYPANLGLVSPPATILIKLPAIPEELDYRIIGRHLILRDVESNLIVDVAPNLLPAQ